MSLSAKEFEDLQKLKGPLKKKSPKMFIGYQKRFFMIVNSGKLLTWFNDENVGSKPKGSIEIIGIEGIKCVGYTDFEITYGGRVFELRAESDSERMEWIRALKKLKDYWVDNFAKEVASTNSNSPVALRSKTIASNKRSSAREDYWREMDPDTIRNIQLEKEKIIFEENKMRKKIENDEILRKKGLKKNLEDIPYAILMPRMILGYLHKKGQQQTSKFQKRWFFLISSKPIFNDSQLDEQIIEDKQLPPKIELDTLYYYSYDGEGDTTERKGAIRMNDCHDIIRDESKNPDKEYCFKINMGDRIYILAAETEFEREMWIDAMRNSIRNSKEMKNTTSGGSAIKIVKKNIDKIIDIYDKSGQENGTRTDEIKNYMNESQKKIIKSMIGCDKIETMNDLHIFLKTEDRLVEELIDVIVACCAKEPKRNDIIDEYLFHYYESICDNLRNFWDRNYKDIENLNLLHFSGWLQNFYDRMLTYLDDRSVLQGISTILNIFVNRIIENVEFMIEGLIKSEKDNQPKQNENNILATTTPYDLFKLINEGFDMAVKVVKSKEMGIKLAFYGKKILFIFQHLLDSSIEDDELDIEQLIAISNNTITFNSLTKEFGRRLLNEGRLNDEDEVEKYFDTPKILKHFGNIGISAKDKLLSFLFLNVTCFFQCYFLDLDLENLLKELIKKYKPTFALLHESYLRKVWKSFLDTLMVNYFHSLIFSCSKSNSNREKFIEKLEYDEEFLESEFDGLIYSSLLVKTLKPFKNIVMLLKTNLFFCLEHQCLKLREHFGPAWNTNTVKLILKIRKDLPSDYIKLVFKNLKECIEEINEKEENSNEEKNKVHEVFWNSVHDKAEEAVKVEQSNSNLTEGNATENPDITEENQPDEEFSLRARTETQFLKKTSSLLLNHQDLDLKKSVIKSEDKFRTLEHSNSFRENQKSEIKRKVFSGEGYLQKKPPKAYKKFWEKRYFRLRNGILYWYKNEKSTEAQNKIVLAQAQECFAYKDKSKFKISINGQKYKFMADTPKEAECWVTAINKEISKEDEDQNKKEEEENNANKFVIQESERKPLFIDYEESSREEKINNILNERKKKDEKKIQQLNKLIKVKEPLRINSGKRLESKEEDKEGTGRVEEVEKVPKKRNFWDSIFS